MIAPWELDELDADWLDAFLSEIPAEVEAHNRKVAEIRANFYAKNLTR